MRGVDTPLSLYLITNNKMTKQELVNAFVDGREGKNHNSNATVEKDGTKVFTLYNTDIAVLKNGILGISNGGYRTVTTKSYINMILTAWGSNWKLIQRKGKWILQEWRKNNVVREVLWTSTTAHFTN